MPDSRWLSIRRADPAPAHETGAGSGQGDKRVGSAFGFALGLAFALAFTFGLAFTFTFGLAFGFG